MRWVRPAGAKVSDVELPAWAADAPDFAAKLAQALESPQVSGQLHSWIDLIFGCKSQGPGAEKADNLFHYLTYDGMCALRPPALCVQYPLNSTELCSFYCPLAGRRWLAMQTMMSLFGGREESGSYCQEASGASLHLTTPARVAYQKGRVCTCCSALQHLEQETNPTMREALRVQMMEFGRTPKQLFRKPHPRRRVAVTGGKPAGACGCFGGPPAAQAARPAANVLHPTFVQVRHELPPHSLATCHLRL